MFIRISFRERETACGLKDAALGDGWTRKTVAKLLHRRKIVGLFAGLSKALQAFLAFA